MAICPFAIWRPISGSSGKFVGGPFKIVHHTTEGSTAQGAMAAFTKNRSDPHFTVDANTIYQHIDTSEGARALRNAPDGVQTNRDSAIQIELVGFAHKPKDRAALTNVARLCRWLEAIHKIPREWPAGLPRTAKNGKDPGGHVRDPAIWENKGGHYGHCHVPENSHWDPAYSKDEVEFLMKATFDSAGVLTSKPLAAPKSGVAKASFSMEEEESTMPAHSAPDEEEAVVKEKKKAKKSANKTKATPQHIFNARPDTLDFRDRMYVPTLIEVPTSIELSEYLKHKVPVLDQGAEGACTGFGLATVANFLQACRKHKPDHTQVSPRMFYELARRYDEWPGEDYSGSSARGAMKGWNKHGVCAETEWKYKLDDDDYGGFNEARMKAAKRRPLGAYFRVNHRDLIAMHAAIAEVRVLYATAIVHDGWNHVGKDGIIEMTDNVLGGHAFAIVAYNEQGFWIQNSWGTSWGRGGLALITYDDWLKNGTDVWVARLGAPVALTSPVAFATAHASTSGQTVAYTYADLRPHLISVGNDGRLRAGGDYGTTERELETIFRDDIPHFMDGSDKKCLLLFAHGGLVDEDAAVQRVAEYRKTLLDAGVYPLAFIWNTDYWSTITNILQDAVRRRRPEGLLDKAKDFMLDRLDDALEPLARTLSGKAAWSEMKENAVAASGKHGAARMVINHILKLRQTYEDLELHVVGHSAGAILQAPIVQLLSTVGKIKTGPMKGEVGAGMTIDTCTLWAPACTTELFHQTYAPAIASYNAEREGGIASFAMFCLNDKAEQSDHCARIYNKSLLYLVSNAFENKPRIPGFRGGEALLGMERFVREDQALLDLFSRPNAELVVAPNNEPEATLNASTARHHGDFDDDKATVMSTFNRILGARTAQDGEHEINVDNLTFSHSQASLTRTRMNIEEQTGRH